MGFFLFVIIVLGWIFRFISFRFVVVVYVFIYNFREINVGIFRVEKYCVGR